MAILSSPKRLRVVGGSSARNGRPGKAEDALSAPPSETLGQAYIRQYDRMRAFLYRRVGDAGTAEELAQDIWVRIAPYADRTDMENPDGWLRRVAVNVVLDWFKYNKFRNRLLEADLQIEDVLHVEEERPDMMQALHARRGLEYLEQLIDDMPPRRRAVFLLYRARGLSLKETAEELGITVKTVKVQMTEALRNLRDKMSEAGLWP
jgi:RNA polymerase sigma factor (sigma-70 family)